MKPAACAAAGLFLFALLPLSASVQAQSSADAEAAAACTAEEARQFDFWLGTWDLTWDGGQGTNHITRTLGGCVIEEHFEGQTPEGLYRGKSVSVYDAVAGQWKQTWVDSRGNYLDFAAGGFAGGQMTLQREGEKDGIPVVQRMVWHNISADGMDWRWELSEDGGQTWTTAWAIRYARAEETAPE